MAYPEVKFVLVPWGSDSSGDDVWLLENALIFGLESIFEKLEIQYADLYDQLAAEKKRSAIVHPYSEDDLLALASKAPLGTSALIDGQILVTREPQNATITSIDFAPRILLVSESTFSLPELFSFQRSSRPENQNSDVHDILSQDAWHSMVFIVAEAVLAPFRVQIPPHVGPETFKLTNSGGAYAAFLKAKRGARTTDEKLGYYRQAIKQDSLFYWARFNAGQLYKQQQDYHAARREFLAATNGAQNNPSLLGDVYFELGLCSIFLGDTKTARNFWDQALQYTPNNPTLLVNIAGTYEQEEDWSNAISLHQLAVDIKPDYHKALVSLGRLKAQSGQIEEAINFYEKALALQPDDALRHAILGGCHLSLGEEDRAREYFETASRLDPPGKSKIVIDEADSQPAPGDYARAEIEKLDISYEKKSRAQNKGKTGWGWFSR